MPLPEIKVSGHGMDITDAIRDYVDTKISKYDKIFDIATSIDVVCTDNVATRGVSKDFKVEISMNLPKTVARVEKSGSNLYAVIDDITDVLVRKVKRYREKLRQWEGKIPWKLAEAGAAGELEGDDDWFVVDYVPEIVKRKVIEDCTPITEAEAIERMEMLDHDSYLFRNKDRESKYCMVYKRKKGGYGIVEPSE